MLQARRSSRALRCYCGASTSGGGPCAALCPGLPCGAARGADARTMARSYGGAPTVGGGLCAACCCGGHAETPAGLWELVSPRGMLQARRSSRALRCYCGASTSGGGPCAALCPGLPCGAARGADARTMARSYGGAPTVGGGLCAACCCGGHAERPARSLSRVGL